MSEAQLLATDVLAMFDLQREYFKTKSPEKLSTCVAFESALKRRCKEILSPTKARPNLFDQIEGAQS